MADNKPVQNAAVQMLQVLFSGTGYNFYSDKNKMRADDLLVRQKASALVSEAAQALNDLEEAYRRLAVPPATRDNPYPPADVMARLREIGRLRDRARDTTTKILTMPVPAQDKIWWRFQQEATLLSELYAYDYNLVEQARVLSEAARQLTAQDWNEKPDASSPLEAALDALEQAIRDRRQFLQIPT